MTNQFLRREKTPSYEVCIVKPSTSITYKYRYVNTIRRNKGCVTAEKWKIQSWEVEIIPVVTDLRVKSLVCVNL